MRKYRLKKWYPGLPDYWKCREAEVTIEGDDFYVSSIEFENPDLFDWESIVRQAQNSPDFWEEVVEKEPLFVTDDGLELFEGETYWAVYLDDDLIVPKVCGQNTIFCNARWFKSEKEAKNWVKDIKPIFSKNLIRHVIEKNKFRNDAESDMFLLMYDDIKKELCL